MIENKGRTALEMAESIGSQPSEIGQNWQTLGQLDWSFFDNLVEKIGIDKDEWSRILAKAGSSLLTKIDQRIFDLEEQVVEQQTAIELRKTFGMPRSLLAMPVFAELGKIEFLAKAALKENSTVVTYLWEQINQQLIYELQLFLAERINAMEAEEQAHKLALANTQKEAKSIDAFQETLTGIEAKFREKMDTLKQQKEAFISSFKQIGGRFVKPIKQVFENTVFQASMQSTAPTTVQ